jgi:hypothetical protein
MGIKKSNKELHNILFSPNIARLIKSRRMNSMKVNLFTCALFIDAVSSSERAV